MSKLLKYLSILLTTCWLLFACHASTPIAVKRPPLRITCNNFVAYRTAIIAQEQGFFKAQGVDVELNYVEFTQLQQADFSAGKYDAIGLTIGSLIILSATNPNIQSVLIVDETNGADVIAAQANIKTVADLKGKKIGVNLGGFGEVFVAEMLKTSKLTPDDVTLIKLEAMEIPQSLETNIVQAGHTWDPYLSRALKKGARILFSSKQTPGLILDLIVFRNQVIRDRPQDIQAFVKGWLQALNYWEANISLGNAIIAKAAHIPSSVLSLDGLNLANLAENQQFFAPHSPNSIYDTAKIYADFFIRSGNITRIPDLKTLFNPSFVNFPP
jgi:NitT/TauT family transport system substrate-binding protein